MNEQVAIQNLLRRKLLEFQSKNASFSVRALANRLGLQPSATNEILRGERRVSRKMAEKIIAKLLLDPTERTEVLKNFPQKRLMKKPAILEELDTKERIRLSADQFEIISDWIHFAILNLIKTANFKSEASWMAERLGITEAAAKAAVERLERLSLLEVKSNGQWVRTYNRVQTTDDVLNVSVQKSHLQDMELAKNSILHDPVELRDFTSLMIPISPALLPRAKEAIRKANNEIAELLQTEPSTEVYRLSTYLFPISKIKKSGVKNEKK